MIKSFQGEHRWLSNFSASVVVLDGARYPSVEAAYQAAKVAEIDLRVPFQGMSPFQAKQAGRLVEVRDDWDLIKLHVMKDLCTQKFHLPFYRDKLMASIPEEIIEGNYWNDTFWGVCKGKGENHLGLIIMEIRFNIFMEESKKMMQADNEVRYKELKQYMESRT